MFLIQYQKNPKPKLSFHELREQDLRECEENDQVIILDQNNQMFKIIKIAKTRNTRKYFVIFSCLRDIPRILRFQ